MPEIRVYTKPIETETYSNSLAHSVHFALKTNKKDWEEWNQGYGILFPRAYIRDNDTLDERGILEPRILQQGTTYYITANLIDKEGNPAEEAASVWWSTENFVRFREYNTETPEEISDIAKGTEQIEIPDSLLPVIRNRWFPLSSTSVELPNGKVLSSLDELETITATVHYSDGSKDRKSVRWDKDSICRQEKDSYTVKGTISPVTPRFPLATGYADPVIFHWDKAWYFLATNDNVDDIGIFIRKADTVDKLFDASTKEYCILDFDEEKGFVQTFWAPEFHVIGGVPYILFAVSGKQWGPQCHMMRLKRGGHPEQADDWETPVRVCRQNGDFLTTDGITLDMTYFRADGTSYLCWSYRKHIGTELDTGSMIYIASTNEKEPWKLTSEPILLSRPLYGWENTRGTINNEGPYPLLLDDKVYIAFSGGDACGYYYAVGYLTADITSNLLDADSWSKTPTSVLSFASLPGIQGPGHNSFFHDEQDRLMIAYHAQEREKYFNRCTTFHRVHIGKDGFPFLNVAGERDIAEEFQHVTFTFKSI